MHKRELIYSALILICFTLSACEAAQSVLDAVLVQAGVDLDATQTAQPSSVISEIAPESNIKNLIPTPTPGAALLEPGQNILYKDDFSDTNSGWDISSDSVNTNGYTDGGYTIKMTEGEYCSWATVYRDFSDVIVEVDTQKLSGSDTDEYGVICRVKDNVNHYFLGITSDGYYGIGKLIDDEWIDLYDNNWAFYREGINTGNGINHIKATCDFENLTLEVNGSTLLQASDMELRSGEVGVYVCAAKSPGAEVLFDNFVVSSVP